MKNGVKAIDNGNITTKFKIPNPKVAYIGPR